MLAACFESGGSPAAQHPENERGWEGLDFFVHSCRYASLDGSV